METYNQPTKKESLLFHGGRLFLKQLSLMLLCFFALNFVQGQNFNRQANINLQIESDTILNPFDGSNVTSIGVSGQVTFKSDLGFVRFVVSDGNDDDYMVYETYRIFEEDSIIFFSQKCEESCFYETFVPTKFVIQLKDAIVNINSVDLSSTYYSNAEYQRLNAATNADSVRLSKIRNYIDNQGLIWMADHTKLSDLSYASRAQLWGRDYKSYGFEYYAGGIYCMFAPNNGVDTSEEYVANFDWRNRHGANTPNTPYYDGDVYGTGWLSPITCQLGCWDDGVLSCVQQSECTGEWRSAGTCWSFGTTAQVEALANLYYNNHLDLDLSEQYPVCQEYLEYVSNGYQQNPFEGFRPDSALDHYRNEGVPYEYCWPYTARPDGCEPSCPEPMDRVGINSYIKHENIGVEDLRHLIMDHGPVSASGIPSQEWISHDMLLVGWGTIDEDSPRVTGLPGHVIPKSYYGITYWIYKNSYGISNDHNMFEGYSYIIHRYTDSHGNDMHTPKAVFEIPVPITVSGMSESDVLCEDKDGDGYYNWGLGPKPAHCPPCPDEPDGDDSNPSLGPVNERGQRTIINTYNSSFENGWDDWIQIVYDASGQPDLDWWRHKGPTGNYGNGNQPLGPRQAQDGEYYIYTDGTYYPYFNNDRVAIQSPPIDFRNVEACDYIIDFYYHMKSYDWGSNEKNKLFIVYLRRGAPPKIDLVAENNQGDEWQHCRKRIPVNTYQIQFVAEHGMDFCDIALDNITIGPWNHDETPIVITDQTVWESSMEIEQDVILENGGKLTIKKSGSSQVNIQMHPESKIIVKPGGQLILDGCKLVCGCKTELWQGIQVWGDKTKDQKKHGDSYYQGYLEMKNQASIEDAICAVELWNPGHWSTTGGIIIADNAIFNNNAKAVHALHYQYNQSGQIADYNAKFTECTFKIGVGYHNTIPFYKHVDLAQVQGVRFNGCTFKIENDVQNISDWTIGIAAYNAGFTVNATFQPNIYPELVKKRSSFSGFQRAIQSVETLEINTPKFTVKHADFRDNDYGIFARKSNYATIVDCDFEVGLNAWYSCNAGIHLDNISSFAIEENRFSKGNKAVDDNFGIILKDSKSQNEIYYNDFDGLYCANLAVGVNNMGYSQQHLFEGLEYGCNENENNDIDFYVLGDDQLSGIQLLQGTNIAPTRNTFSEDAYHFYNGGTHRVTYAYYDNPSASDEVPLRYNEDKFIPNPSSQLWECVSHYGNGGGSNNGSETPVLTSAQKQQIEQDYYDAYYPYALVKSAYDRLIDGGNTNATLAEIDAATPADMWRLRSQLLGASPFVSQDVLFAAGDRDDVFTESVLFEILLSNPDELKKDTLMHYLENRVPPMPGYMMSILNQVANGSSARTAMESQMSSYRRAFSRAAGDMVRSILNDTVVDMAELRGWLGNMNDLNADRDIIATYMAEGDFDNAFYLANMLPGLYGLEGAALQEHDDYMVLLNLYRNLQTDNRNTLQLNDTELAVVEDMADNGAGVAKAMAQSILEGAYGYHFEDCPVVPYPEGGTRGMAGNLISPEDMGKALGFTVSLKPNPATTWIAIDYTLPMDYGKATVEIVNTLGVKVLQKQLNAHEGQSVVDLRGLANGVYTLTVMCGGYVRTEKLVISR